MTHLEIILRTPWAGPWRAFRDPLAILTAATEQDVRGCLDDVDRAVSSEGCYAAGFVTYEAAAGFGLPAHPPPAGGLPLVCFGLFAPDRVTSQARPRPQGTYEAGPWNPSLDHAEYLEAIGRIRSLIEAGVTYQINFTFRLRSRWSGDPLALLADLDAAQMGAWGAWVDTGRHVVCSASPELFFTWVDGRLECRPMKGTAPRGLWSAADLAAGEALRQSPKNRAENVMIVDMVRNDLSRLARATGVKVVSLFDVERFPRQWQMTSTVVADAPGVRLATMFEAMFPSGSVTGAPKHSSMGIIRDLEATPRGIYTGAVGYVSPHKRAHFSVAIRTITIDRERSQAEFGVGSGIVWDSIDRDEYDECLLKASILTRATQPFRLLETIGYDPASGFALLDRHFARLKASADYFGYALDEGEARDMLQRAIGDLRGRSRLRLLLARDGSLVCQAVDLIAKPARPLRGALAAEPVDVEDAFLYHKTTRREVYERARASRPGAEAVILWNASGEVTEGTDANVVASIGGRTVTPPVECGLLAGTFRAQLLEEGELYEQRISVADLFGAERVWLINSVRGWMEIAMSTENSPS